MARSPRIKVVGLRRKFDLAVRHGLAADRGDLAGKIGSTPKTLRWWESGVAATRPADHMPERGFERLAALFASALPDMKPERVRTLLLDPPDHLEDALRGRAYVSPLAGILGDAVDGEARLIRRSGETGLSEIDRPETDGLPMLRMGERFRIAFAARHRCRFAFALQNAGRRWCAHETARDAGDRTVLVPGLSAPGVPSFLYESEQTGEHSFLCIQSVAPFPAQLASYQQEPVDIDLRALETLAGFYDGLTASDRACQRLSLRIEGPTP